MNIQKCKTMFKKVLLIALTAIVFCSCSYDNWENPNKLTDDFKKYYDDNSIFYSSKNTEFVIANIGKDDEQRSNYVMIVGIGNDGAIAKKQQNWTRMTIEEKKHDLKECADLFVKYASENEIDSNYNFYVITDLSFEIGRYVYELSTDSIWIPKCEKYILSGKDVKTIDDFQRGYKVYINDGEFKQIGREYSDKY